MFGAPTLALDQLATTVGIISAIRMDDAACWQIDEEHFGGAAVCLARVRWKASGRPYRSVMAWTLVLRPPRLMPIVCSRAPFFPPAAERWAYKSVLSIGTSAAGP